MHIPPVLGRILKLGLIVMIAAITVMTAGSRSNMLTSHDKAYYADPNLLNFVRPGLVLKVVSAGIASDGTITAKVRITDLKGVGLDRDGVVTPGPVSISCMAAYIPSGQTQYVAYTTRIQNSPITNKSATQAGTDSGGTWAAGSAAGDYTYTFRTKAPTNFDQSATHSVGCQASRSLTEFDLGTNYATNVYTFVPNGSPVTVTRDVIKTESCNKCHDELAFHGGSRRGIEYCVMCHTPQTTDPDTGNTVDMPVMVHKIHMGNQLPSVKAGGHYQIIGFNQNVSDWSTVGLPSDPGNCTVCHEQGKGAAQEKAYLKPNRAACGACHDNVNFATGENHVDLPQVSDSNCATCHIPQGELPRDASILGAHIPTDAAMIIPDKMDFVPGMIFGNLQVQNGTAGKAPTITFTMKDKAGNPIMVSDLKTSPNRLAAVMAGPTSDYGYTSFGTDVSTGGYVSEDLVAGGATCDQSGNCSYTFKHIVPTNAKGTFAIGLEGRRGLVLLPGTQKELDTEYGAKNVVAYFSVDGSQVTPRRQVVSIDKCNQCHSFLSLHGTNRNQIEQCVLCHNPSETDKARRPVAQNPNDKNTPPQAIDFAYMIHRIHTGEELTAMGAGYTVVGFGGSHNDFSEVRYPAFSPSGSPGDRRNCSMCHVNGSETNLPSGLNAMTNPQSPVNPTPRVTAVCTGCHADLPALAHAVANTASLSGQSVESCAACHRASADFSVTRVHAQ
jgi:OmcA/MtrC family decaheme c-type cytochrome